MTPQQEIQALLQAFQDGYIHRDVTRLDTFMKLFAPDAEVIGTNGARPGVDEWYLDRDSARELVEGDWLYWGDLRLDLASASIHTVGDVGWVAATATVSRTIGEENYAAFLKFVKDFIDQSPLSAERKLHYILRGGTNTVYELRRGEKFIWPLRFTAVVVHQADGWKFAQMNFSFPTTHFPDVRIVENE
ncbi:MAG TPA: nuclear transport factor 2 family protein [Anaerolineaceae bacterium]|nr:nuclear transport factor 2 family protein [Anaerolineaceae bacterium]HPN53525.1 nuclear transport factor 2 family protein [Anaerolineaceae bacterium]